MGGIVKTKRFIFGGSVSVALMLWLSGQSKGWVEPQFTPRFEAQPRAEAALPKSILAAINKPGRNAVGAAGQAGNAMIQYQAGGHIFGFTAEGVLIASGTHALRLEFVGAIRVQPVSQGNGFEKEDASAIREAPPLTEVSYPGLWPGITLKYEGKIGSVVKKHI
jgi:hypothetical protein